MPRYFSNASRADRVEPGKLPGAIGILSDPDQKGGVIGVAYSRGHIGGWRVNSVTPEVDLVDLGPIEAGWRLVIGKEELEGRWALRAGEFIELAEDAL